MDWTQVQINSMINKARKDICNELAALNLDKLTAAEVETISHAVSLINHLFAHSEYAQCYVESVAQ